MQPSVFVHQLFVEQARRTPHATAVVDAHRSLSYRELDRHSDAVARALLGRGVEQGDLVGVCLERGSRLVVGLLGILKCGAAYVPLDASYPAERLAYIVDCAAPALVLTEAATRACLQTLQLPSSALLCMDADDALIASQDVEFAPVARTADALADSLAYVMFTSGSTGRPKGVPIRQASLANLLSGMQALLCLQPDDRWLALAPVSFDISVLEIFLPLCIGASVMVATREQATDAARLAQLMMQGGISVMQATPATWRMLQGIPEMQGARQPLLRQAICGGEAWGRELGDVLLRIGAIVWNMYGPTETTIWSTALRIARDGDIHLGQPIQNTTLHVLDENLQPLAPGGAGELHIGGAGLARGYLGQPELSAEKFIANPFGPGQLYKTGDLARWRDDGGVDYLGRLDFQIKLRGHRIELGEIEEGLVRHPAVLQAVVAPCTDSAGHTRLAAYYQAHETATVSSAELRRHLSASLPDYMIPSAYMRLPRLPLNANGKVDRKALPLPEQGFSEAADYVEPRTVNEVILARIWADVLGVERVGALDNFFDLGGDSLIAAGLLQRVNQRFGTDITLAVLLGYDTVADMAAMLGQPHFDVSPKRSLRLNTAAVDAIPLFCIPPIGGVATVFAPLARALSGQVPIHALQVSGLRYARDQGDQVLAMPQLVAAYQAEIEVEIGRLGLEGHLRLMGYSAGGGILHALCAALLASGHEIEQVFLLNPYCRPPENSSDYDHTGDFWNICSDLLVDAFDLHGAAAQSLMTLSRAMWPDASGAVDAHADFSWPRAWPDAHKLLPDTISPEVYELLMQGMHTTWLAYREYRPAPFKAAPRFKNICMLQPDADSAEYRQARQVEWSAYMNADLPTRLIPGEHAKLLRNPQSVAAIARHIRQCCA